MQKPMQSKQKQLEMLRGFNGVNFYKQTGMKFI